MTSQAIIDIISNSFKYNELIDEKIILGDDTNIPNMFELSNEINRINSKMKIEINFKDCFIIKYNYKYYWITYYRNNSDNIIDFIITGHSDINEIFKEM